MILTSEEVSNKLVKYNHFLWKLNDDLIGVLKLNECLILNRDFTLAFSFLRRAAFSTLINDFFMFFCPDRHSNDSMEDLFKFIKQNISYFPNLTENDINEDRINFRNGKKKVFHEIRILRNNYTAHYNNKFDNDEKRKSNKVYFDDLKSLIEDFCVILEKYMSLFHKQTNHICYERKGNSSQNHGIIPDLEKLNLIVKEYFSNCYNNKNYLFEKLITKFSDKISLQCVYCKKLYNVEVAEKNLYCCECMDFTSPSIRFNISQEL